MPLIGSCSLAISAACHQPARDGEPSLKAVMWGAVTDGKSEDGPTHCYITIGDVSQVQDGKRILVRRSRLACSKCVMVDNSAWKN